MKIKNFGKIEVKREVRMNKDKDINKLNKNICNLLNSLMAEKVKVALKNTKKNCNNCKRLNDFSPSFCCGYSDEERKEIGYICKRWTD